MHVPLSIARHQHLLWADAFHDEVVGVGNLALVADVHPAAIPDVLEFVGEDLRIVVEAAMHAMPLNELTPIDCAHGIAQRTPSVVVHRAAPRQSPSLAPA